MRFVSFLGLFGLVGLAWLMSSDRRRFPFRIVMWGIALQLVFGLVVLSPAAQEFFFAGVDAGVRKLLSFSEQGATFVFSSTLRASELSRMNLHLSRLDFVDHTRVKGVLGAMDATVNLWVAAEDIAFDLKALPARDAYLITTREPVLAGMYAFHAQDVLNEEDERVLLNLPKEMQVAFPFEVM